MAKNFDKRKAKHKNNKQNKADGLWFYGKHAVVAALKNPQREVQRILTTKSGKEILEQELEKIPKTEVVEADMVMRYTPNEVPNQGMVALVKPLKDKAISELKDSDLLIFLDQVTDPHNIGAILRSAAAFGAQGVIVHEQNSPHETGTMAKSASGALEIVPLIRVQNLTKAMDELKSYGFWFLGMDGKAETSLKDAPKYDKVAIVMGAEGKGLRRLTAEQCDLLVKLPIKRTIESLNVSNAAAIALYELS